MSLRSRMNLALQCLLWTLAALLLVEVVEARMATRRRTRERMENSTAASHGYRRFHANDTYVWKPIPCTDDEKVCFGYNLVLDTDSDTCQAIGGGYVGGCILRVDRKEYEETSGRVFGVCQEFGDPCEGYRMAYDGRCYTKDVVRNVICGCEAPPTRHILGDFECRCSAPRAEPVRVQQPKEAGRCRIPDLRFPDLERAHFKESSLRAVKMTNANCTAQQRKCFGEEKVWVEPAGGCFPLLKRGPCAADEVVALSKAQWTSGAAACVQERGGCPPGRVRMGFDGACHAEREMRIAAPGRLVMNILGEYDVLGYNEGVQYKPALHGYACTFQISGVNGPPPHRLYPLPQCTGKEPHCSLYETFSIPPTPE